jgi:hypothetical protein
VRVFVDNCLNFRISRLLIGHEVRHATDLGYDRLENGVLISTVAVDFDVLLTRDLEMRFQLNTKSLPIPIVILHTAGNRYSDLEVFDVHLGKLLSADLSPNLYCLKPDGTIELPPFSKPEV